MRRHSALHDRRAALVAVANIAAIKMSILGIELPPPREAVRGVGRPAKPHGLETTALTRGNTKRRSTYAAKRPAAQRPSGP
jgi:hypothetical protein